MDFYKKHLILRVLLTLFLISILSNTTNGAGELDLKDFKLELAVNEPINIDLNQEVVTGGTSPYVWSVGGGFGILPEGLHLTVGGILYGTPSRLGSSDVYFTVHDRLDASDTAKVSFSIVNDSRADLPNRSGPNSMNGDYTGIDLTIDDLISTLRGLVCHIYNIALILIIIFIVWTGIKYLLYSSNPDKIKSTNTAFLWVIVGSLVILGVGVIIATISVAVGVSPVIPIVCN